MSEPKIRVSYGPNELEITSGTASNVAELRAQVEAVLNVPAGAKVSIDGVEISAEAEKLTPIPEKAKEISFTKESGSKAL